MKTTIKHEGGKALVVQPCEKLDALEFSVTLHGVRVGSMTATPDQVGALIFGLEQAMEALQVRRQAAAAVPS